MGLEPFLLASAVRGIVAQRLVRKICERCKEPIPTPRAIHHLFQGDVPTEIYRGVGCEDCRGTGFLGRQGIYEFLVLNDRLRNLMLERASEITLTEMARRLGMTTLREASMARVVDGTTTVDEVMRVTMASDEDAVEDAVAPPSFPPKP